MSIVLEIRFNIFLYQDADVIITGDYTGDGIESSKPSQIMISPNGKVVAIHQEKRVNLYSVLTGELVGSIQDPHTQPIVKVCIKIHKWGILNAYMYRESRKTFLFE